MSEAHTALRHDCSYHSALEQEIHGRIVSMSDQVQQIDLRSQRLQSHIDSRGSTKFNTSSRCLNRTLHRIIPPECHVQDALDLEKCSDMPYIHGVQVA